MTVNDIVKQVDACQLTQTSHGDVEITAAFAADLMSDVIAFVDDHVLLITGLTNIQVLRTAELLDIQVILFVRGKRPSVQIIEEADKMGIALYRTMDTMFVTSGKLYSSGLTEAGVREIQDGCN